MNEQLKSQLNLEIFPIYKTYFQDTLLFYFLILSAILFTGLIIYFIYKRRPIKTIKKNKISFLDQLNLLKKLPYKTKEEQKEIYYKLTWIIKKAFGLSTMTDKEFVQFINKNHHLDLAVVENIFKGASLVKYSNDEIYCQIQNDFANSVQLLKKIEKQKQDINV